jgi:hypothetical protein
MHSQKNYSWEDSVSTHSVSADEDRPSFRDGTEAEMSHAYSFRR